MSGECEHDNGQDMAKSRYDSADSESSKGNADNQAVDAKRNCCEESQIVSQENSSIELPDIAEYHEATPDERAEMLVSRSWHGMLPPPESFNQYPSEVQDKIVAWASDSALQQQKLTDSAIAMDKADSDRLDRLLEMERKERKFGQIATVLLDTAIIAASVYTASINQPIVATALVGVFMGINVFSVFGQTLGDGKKKDDKPAG